MGGDARQVAILVAASPTAAFYSQIATLSLALRDLRWSRWRPSLHVYLGGPDDPAALDQWRPHLRDVHLHWTSSERVESMGDWAQSDEVFISAPADADVLLAMDADTFPVASLEEVLDRVLRTNAVAGVIAHYPPFPCPEPPRRDFMRDTWRQVAHGLIDAELEFPYSHTLLGPEAPVNLRPSPFYLNFGVVFFSRRAFLDIAPRYLEMRPLLMPRLLLPDFSGQIALTLAITDAGTATWALPMRFNFPNDAMAERQHPLELEHATVFHYLRTDVFDRHRIFTSAEEYGRFLSLPLQGVNRRFQQAVRTVLGERYPFS